MKDRSIQVESCNSADNYCIKSRNILSCFCLESCIIKYESYMNFIINLFIKTCDYTLM